MTQKIKVVDMTKSSGSHQGTWEDLESFQAAVAQERAQRLAYRRIACVIAWGLIAVASSFVGLLLRATLLLSTSPLAITIFLALLIAAEINFIRLGNALREEFKWPRSRRVVVRVDVDTSDIPEADEEWFKKAELRTAR